MGSLFHFVRYQGTCRGVNPLCGDWLHNLAWTTLTAAVTCPACAHALAVRSTEASILPRVAPRLAQATAPRAKGSKRRAVRDFAPLMERGARGS